jgi:hypothetical protein
MPCNITLAFGNARLKRLTSLCKANVSNSWQGSLGVALQLDLVVAHRGERVLLAHLRCLSLGLAGLRLTSRASERNLDLALAVAGHARQAKLALQRRALEVNVLKAPHAPGVGVGVLITESMQLYARGLRKTINSQTHGSKISVTTLQFQAFCGHTKGLKLERALNQKAANLLMWLDFAMFDMFI